MNIKDIARLAGVSIATVSRVVNESKRVGEEIKQRVLVIIRQYNYEPNPDARELALRRNGRFTKRITGYIEPIQKRRNA